MKTRCLRVALPSGAVIDHRLNKLDRNYALTATGIGVSYFFDTAIDIDRLLCSLEKLMDECPALAGRPDFRSMSVVLGDGYIPIEIVEDYPGRAADYVSLGKNIRNRADFVFEPKLKAVRKGKAPIMCVRLTRFSMGGCALGVTLNHAVMDSKGFHLLMRRWSDIFLENEGQSVVMSEDMFKLSTDRPLDQLLEDIERSGRERPHNYGNLSGRMLKGLIYIVLDKLKKRDREMIYLSPVEVENLRELVRGETGQDALSRNIALSAHIIHALIPMQVDPDETRIKLANVVNIRDRLRGPEPDRQNLYVGNAVYLMLGELRHASSVHELSRGDIAKAIQRDFDGMSEANIWRDMRNIVDSLNADHGYPGITTGGAIMGINNQSKFDVYNVDFGAGRPLRVVPQEVGDHIMMFPASDGGVEIYVRDFASQKRQKKLLEPEWLEMFKRIPTAADKDLVAVA